MIDLAIISEEVLRHRGAYSTVRAAHEDAKKELQILCGKLSTFAAQILRKMQPDNDVAPDEVAIAELLAGCRSTVYDIEQATTRIESLARQRAELKPLAWPRQ